MTLYRIELRSPEGLVTVVDSMDRARRLTAEGWHLVKMVGRTVQT